MRLRDTRPKWAGAPTLPLALRAAEEYVSAGGHRPVLDAMRAAKPLVFRKQDLAGLPAMSMGEIQTMLARPNLPFPCTYLETPIDSGLVLGCLLTRRGTQGEIVAVPIFGAGYSFVYGTLARCPGTSELGLYDVPSALDNQSSLDDALQSCIVAAGYAFAALCLWESPCAVVEPVPVSRQVRRAAEREGSEIALCVMVRRKYRKRTPGSTTNARDYSHRFDRAGHWKHHPAGTRIADNRPELIRDWVDAEGRAHPQSRRIWCPPTVIGDEALPYVPKERALVVPSGDA